MHRPSPIRFASPLTIIAGLVFTVVCGAGVARLYGGVRLAERRAAEMGATVRALEGERDALAHTVAFTESERGKEELYRTRYDVVQDGETLVLLEGVPKQEAATATQATATTQVARPWWYLWR